MKLTHVIDAFVAGYQGRDEALPARLDFWRVDLGDQELTSITAEAVEAAMDRLAARGQLDRGRRDNPAGQAIGPQACSPSAARQCV